MRFKLVLVRPFRLPLMTAQAAREGGSALLPRVVLARPILEEGRAVFVVHGFVQPVGFGLSSFEGFELFQLSVRLQRRGSGSRNSATHSAVDDVHGCFSPL